MRTAKLAAVLCVAALGALSSWAQAEEAKPEKAKAAPSICAGLDSNACGAKAECVWHKAAKLKSGKERKAHCQKKPQRAAKTTAPT
jgi:hypothetical protein